MPLPVLTVLAGTGGGFGDTGWESGFGDTEFETGFGDTGCGTSFGETGCGPDFGDTGCDSGFGETGCDPGFGDAGLDPGFGDTGLETDFGDAGFGDIGLGDTGAGPDVPKMSLLIDLKRSRLDRLMLENCLCAGGGGVGESSVAFLVSELSLATDSPRALKNSLFLLMAVFDKSPTTDLPVICQSPKASFTAEPDEVIAFKRPESQDSAAFSATCLALKKLNYILLLAYCIFTYFCSVGVFVCSKVFKYND